MISAPGSLAAAFVARASQCHAPKHFRELLDNLQTVLPYDGLLCGWGSIASSTLAFVFNHRYPLEFSRWYLTRGMLWKDPAFLEWLQTGEARIWIDYANPEILEQAMRFHVQYTICGGSVRGDIWIGFAANMASEETARKHMEPFEAIVPALSGALIQAYPRPLLSSREISILERRALGEGIKQIAAAEGITDRTVRMHLQRIKKKLYTDDLLNAVVIADKVGMIGRGSEAWNWT
jgi:DNA-binding CsgD family transcriptional regulator